jgi:hypothetical protein
VAAHVREPRRRQRAGGEEAGARLLQPKREFHRTAHLLDAIACAEARVVVEQALQRRHLREARQAVVAEVDHAARLKLAAHELEQLVSLLCADPGPHPVQGDEVRLLQLLLQQLGEALLQETDIADARVLRQLLRVADVGRIEIHPAEPPLRVGRRVQGGRVAVAAAELDVGELPASARRLHAAKQRDVAQLRRAQLAEVAVRVVEVDDIAFRPGRFGHR